MATRAKKTANVPATTTKPAPADIAWPIIPTTNEIAERCAPLEKRVKEVEVKAASFQTIGADNAAEALEYVRFISGGEQSIEKRRTVYVKPANDFVKTINSITKGFTERMQRARKALAQRILAYQQEEQRKADEEARLKREAEERDAEARAKKLEAKGDAEGAQMLRDIVATAPPPKTDVAVRSESGAKAVVTEYWSGEVVDMKTFLTALNAGQLFPYVVQAHVTVSKAALNELAKANKEHEGKTIFGMKVIKSEGLR